MKPIPSLESVSSEYARLTGLHHELMARGADTDAEIAALHAEMGREAVPNHQAARVAVLLAGVDFTPPAPIRDRLAALSGERADIDMALRELAGQIAMERDRASRLVADQFKADHAALARRFFLAIAQAAQVHAEFEEMRIAFHRAGVQPDALTDFGREIFDKPGYRNSDVGIALRDAVRRGLIKENELPGFAK